MLKRSICSKLMVDAERGVANSDLPNPKISTSSPGKLRREPVMTISSIASSS